MRLLRWVCLGIVGVVGINALISSQTEAFTLMDRLGERFKDAFVRKPEPIKGRFQKVQSIQRPLLQTAFKEQSLRYGNPLYIRIFKLERELEVWVQKNDGSAYELFKTYPICSFSGDLGPKLKEGDRQSPEGFYTVAYNQLNPASRFHLSFNLGFPNRYDQSHGRTGSFLMVHGGCLSVGCYAMSNAGIEEIYTLVEASLVETQNKVPVHAFPFRMTPKNLERFKESRWINFWQSMAPAYSAFEETKLPPSIRVNHKSYQVIAEQ